MSNPLWMLEETIREEEITLRWFDRNEIRFTTSFFKETIETLPQGTPRKTSEPEELLEILKDGNIKDPSGFIFHMTRCGSTLISQMLKEDPKNLVLSEPGPIEVFLNIDNMSQPMRLFYFAGAVKSIGKSLRSPEEKYFVKLAYNAKWIKAIKEIFPNTPIIFVYRDLKEIVASNLKNPPQWLLDYTTKDKFEEVLIELFKIQIAQVEIDHESIDLFIDYKDISNTLPNQVLSCFNLDIRDQELITKMNNSMSQYSKKSQISWSEQKNKSLDLNLELKSKKVLDDLYHKLQNASIKS